MTGRTSRRRSVGPERLTEFLARGFRGRDFFPHSYCILPKAGPDAYRLGRSMCRVDDPAAQREIVLYAGSPAVDEFPDELFFDRELIWHEQQFGLRGQVASANLVVVGSALYCVGYLSDLVQRISRRRAYKTRIEKRFGGWPSLMLNAILSFAREQGYRAVCVASADQVLQSVERDRSVDQELVHRIYDRAIERHYSVDRKGLWWRIDVAKNLDRVVMPDRVEVRQEHGKTVCVCHDVERGLGHTRADPEFARSVDGPARDALAGMLRIEERLGLKATYHVLGCLMGEVQEQIERGGHACAFHSYDHVIRLPAWADGPGRLLKGALRRFTRGRLGQTTPQLAQCRSVDQRLKGYRPPQSRITPELTDENLTFHNFEWLASSAGSLGSKTPYLNNGPVKIPTLFDDFALYRDRLDYRVWEEWAVRLIETHDFVAFSLHDCYADFWLPHYERLLERIGPLGRFRTLNQISAETLLAHAL